MKTKKSQYVYRFPVRMTEEQERMARQMIGCVRVFHNHILSLHNYASWYKIYVKDQSSAMDGLYYHDRDESIDDIERRRKEHEDEKLKKKDRWIKVKDSDDKLFRYQSEFSKLKKDFPFLSALTCSCVFETGVRLDRAFDKAFDAETVKERQTRIADAKTDEERFEAIQYGFPNEKQRGDHPSLKFYSSKGINSISRNSISLTKFGLIEVLSDKRFEAETIEIKKGKKQFFVSGGKFGGRVVGASLIFEKSTSKLFTPTEEEQKGYDEFVAKKNKGRRKPKKEKEKFLKRTGGWWISINCEIEFPEKKPTPKSVGIDRGIRDSISLSDGREFSIPRKRMKELQERKARLQRQLNKMQGSKKGQVKSKNYLRKSAEIARVDRKLTNIRENFYHQHSKHITEEYGVISIEELKIKNMSKSAKGTKENPGKNVKQKSGLNREILNQSWGRLTQQLKYKAEWTGSIVEEVPPHYTSQICPECGKKTDSRDTGKIFECSHCDFEGNRDTEVGAVEINKRGIKQAKESGKISESFL